MFQGVGEETEAEERPLEDEPRSRPGMGGSRGSGSGLKPAGRVGEGERVRGGGARAMKRGAGLGMGEDVCGRGEGGRAAGRGPPTGEPGSRGSREAQRRSWVGLHADADHVSEG